MTARLRKKYFILISPAVLLAVIVYLLQELNLWEGVSYSPSHYFPLIVFVLAISVGVAIPIFLRVYFFSQLKEKKFFTLDEFISYQEKIISVISITPYFAFIAALVNMEPFYFGGTVLAAIYAMYYHFPSDKKIAFDKKVFRVKENPNG
jgi:hypothetical protein